MREEKMEEKDNKMEKLIEKMCQNNDYEKILLEVLNSKAKMDVREVLLLISDNPKLQQKEKDELYIKIMEYTKSINVSFENRIKDIYLQGYREAHATTLLFHSYTADKDGKMDKELEESLNDFIIERLKKESTLDKKSDYKKLLKEIGNQTEDVNKLIQLCELKNQYEKIESYKIGFINAIKLLK